METKSKIRITKAQMPRVPIKAEEALRYLPNYAGVYVILSQNGRTKREALKGLERSVLEMIGRVMDPDERKSLVETWETEKKTIDEIKLKGISESMKFFSDSSGKALPDLDVKYIPVELLPVYKQLLDIFITKYSEE